LSRGRRFAVIGRYGTRPLEEGSFELSSFFPLIGFGRDFALTFSSSSSVSNSDSESFPLDVLLEGGEALISFESLDFGITFEAGGREGGFTFFVGLITGFGFGAGAFARVGLAFAGGASSSSSSSSLPTIESSSLFSLSSLGVGEGCFFGVVFPRPLLP